MKKLVTVLLVFFCILFVISACGKKVLPTGALDATFTYTYTQTPTTTPNMRYDVVVFKGGVPDMGQIVSFKNSAQAAWTPVTVNPVSGLASFDHISEYGKYDVKISALNSCYDEYNYQIDLKGSTVTVINRNDTPSLEVTSDSGFDTFGVYPQTITYTVKLKTDYPYTVNNFIVEGLPASCSAAWDTSTSDMKDNNDFIRLYITTPPSYLNNITFTVKAAKANCVSPNKIIAPLKTITRAWSINSSMRLIYYKTVDYSSMNCLAAMDNYGIGATDLTFAPVGFSDTINWEISSVDIQTCGYQSFNIVYNCANCSANMGCIGTYPTNYFKRWYTNTYWTHNDCYSTMTVKVRFYNSRGLNTYQYFRTTNYPSGCWDQFCSTETPASDGYGKSWNNTVVSGTEQ